MRNLVFAMLIVIALPCVAEEQKLPILLEIPRDIGASSGPGLISLWADNAVNKQSADRVRRFKEAIGTLDFPAAAAQAIACIATNKETANCHEVRIIERDPKDTDDLLRETLKGLPAHRAILVSITSEMVPAQMLIRVVRSDVQLEKGNTIQRRRIMSALVLRHAPTALTVDENKSALALEEYWRGGEMPHIVAVVREALGEAATLLNTLDATLDESGKRPKDWDDLPKIRDLEKSGRIKCSGGPCSTERVLKDNGDTFWLVQVPNIISGGNLPPQFGTAIGSFDSASAIEEANLWAYIFLGLFR